MDLCLALISKVRQGARDFKVCGLYTWSLKLEGAGANCTFNTHDGDLQGSHVTRLELQEAVVTR